MTDALIGLACGDALGTTLEFARPPAVRHVDITGGGPFGLLPGQVTDDTHLAICLHRSLRDHGVDVDALIAEYVAWAAVPPFDIGITTRDTIARLARGQRDAGRAVWEASGQQHAANGSLMRCAPIGMRYADRATRLAAVFDDGALTHFDPRCQLACAAFTGAIARTGDAIAIAEEELAAAAVALAARHPDLDVAGAERALADDLAAARADDPDVDALHHEGFVRTAFRLAFWAVAHARDYAEGVIDVVNRGGDADTNGAIAGALLGSRHAVPARWRERVLACAPPEPWRTRYHPRELLRRSDASSSG